MNPELNINAMLKTLHAKDVKVTLETDTISNNNWRLWLRFSDSTGGLIAKHIYTDEPHEAVTQAFEYFNRVTKALPEFAPNNILEAPTDTVAPPLNDDIPF